MSNQSWIHDQERSIPSTAVDEVDWIIHSDNEYYDNLDILAAVPDTTSTEPMSHDHLEDVVDWILDDSPIVSDGYPDRTIDQARRQRESASGNPEGQPTVGPDSEHERSRTPPTQANRDAHRDTSWNNPNLRNDHEPDADINGQHPCDEPPSAAGNNMDLDEAERVFYSHADPNPEHQRSGHRHGAWIDPGEPSEDDLLSIRSTFSPIPIDPDEGDDIAGEGHFMQVDEEVRNMGSRGRPSPRPQSSSSPHRWSQPPFNSQPSGTPDSQQQASGKILYSASVFHSAIQELHHRLERQSHAMHALQRSLQEQFLALAPHLERLADQQRHAAAPRPRRAREPKDSTANYFRRCIRTHVKLRLGMCATELLPDRPPQNVIDREMSRINFGEDPVNPFLFDLGDSLSSNWNLCVQKYFFHDFWASVNAHVYEGSQIPLRYQRREMFVEVYNTHMAHLKKTWQEQQRPLDQTRKDEKRKHSTRNSRITTTYRNRRDAAATLPPSISTSLVQLITRIGSAGISSDEEILEVRPRQYAIFEKPWRAEALCHLYRHLDLIHAANRNPNGNPIRTRHRTMRTRGQTKPPKKLPEDCFNGMYLRQITLLEREFLEMTQCIGVETLLSEVQRLAI